jgi:hypothetical protein
MSKNSDFYKVIENSFDFLINNYGFTIEEPYEDYVELKSKNCKVVIVAGNNQCNVSIGPIGRAAKLLKSINLKTNTIDVEIILNKLVPTERFEKKYSIFTIEDIENEVLRNVLLIKRHCMKMLSGDFSEWELLYK